MTKNPIFIHKTIIFQTSKKLSDVEKALLPKRFSRMIYQSDTVFHAALVDVRQFKNITVSQMQTKEQDLVINQFDEVEQVFSVAYDFVFLLENQAKGFIMLDA